MRAAFLAFGYNGCSIKNLSLATLAVLAKRGEIVCSPLTPMLLLNIFAKVSFLACMQWSGRRRRYPVSQYVPVPFPVFVLNDRQRDSGRLFLWQ